MHDFWDTSGYKEKIYFMASPGNKYGHIDKINTEINKCSNEIYIEPFIGSCNVILNLQKDFKKKIGYDINKHILGIINTFSNINYNMLFEVYNNIVCMYGNIGKNKESYYKLRDYYNKVHYNNESDEGNVILFYLIRSCINSMSRFGPNGFNQSFGDRGRDAYFTNSSFNIIKSRLNTIEFEEKNFFNIDTGYFDKSDTVWFLDPPYFNSTDTVYGKNFTNNDINGFLDIISNISGKVIFTHFEDELIDAKLESWRKVLLRKYNVSNISPNTKKQSLNIQEIMYCNF
ncbi:MAG: DNA adenine methylase [Bacteroidetes bacterium]|nr:DNA adenine methylase [Bacteroidota bacterium]